jgi:hypothetical protein
MCRPVLDVEAAVEVGVVDQALPAHGGARLLEVDAHHDIEAVLDLVGQAAQAARIVQGGIDVVDGAGAHHHQQARVLAVEDALDGLATLDDGALGGLGEGDLLLEGLGGDQDVLGQDVEVMTC